MGKYLFEYGVPALVLLSFAWYGLRWWYLKRFGHVVKNHKEMKKATKKYEKELG